ncbi:hypothetical protein OAG71_05275 [bacterium]|nr:hypothetical protein [bacterium]
MNEINIFLGTNTGDGATVLSNLGGSSTYNWSQGDFNSDGDVDSSQLNIFTGQQNGDYAIFLANLGRNVRPVGSQSVTSQPVAYQPVAIQPVVAQPLVALSVVSEAATMAPAALSVSTDSNVGSAIEPVELISESAQVQQTSSSAEVSVSDTSLSVTPVNQPVLSSAQADVSVSSGNSISAQSLPEANAALVAPVSLNLELEGAHELLDGVFSGGADGAGDVQDDADGGNDEATVDGFAGVWDWPSFT